MKYNTPMHLYNQQTQYNLKMRLIEIKMRKLKREELLIF